MSKSTINNKHSGILKKHIYSQPHEKYRNAICGLCNNCNEQVNDAIIGI